MIWEAWVTVTITGIVLVTLVVSRYATELVMMAAVVALVLLGILPEKEALAGFGNSGLITVAAMFVIAAALRSSGGADYMLQRMMGQTTELRSALWRMAIPVTASSAFINNTPIVATLIPTLHRWCTRNNVSPSKMMIPLSYAAILGGTISLIGTSTNLVINGQYQLMTGEPGFSLFSIAPIGIPVALLGVAFMVLFMPRLLPERSSAAQAFANKKEFTFEVAVASNGPLVGKSIIAAGLRNLQRIYLAEIERGGSIVTAVPSEERLQAGDRLVFVGDTNAIVDVLRIKGLVASENGNAVIDKTAPERRLVEAVVSPHCDGIGQTIRDFRFRDRYGAVVLAVARNGEPVQGNLGSIKLMTGDLLLLEARPDFVSRQRHLRDFLLINDLNEDRPDHAKAPWVWGILLVVILAASSGVTSMVTAALIGAGMVVALQCISVQDARQSVDLGVLLTIAASLGLGSALEKSGAAAYLAEAVMSLANNDPLLLLIITYVMVSLATEIITNTAAAVLMLPLVLAMCGQLGLNPQPYVMTIMMAASASFATPIGYQTNLMVMGPGGYHFRDFLKAGLVMNIFVGIITVSLVPWVWNLQL